jgi:hypothetical protein
VTTERPRSKRYKAQRIRLIPEYRNGRGRVGYN